MSGSQSKNGTHEITRQSKPLSRDKAINITRPRGDLDVSSITVLKIARINMLNNLIK